MFMATKVLSSWVPPNETGLCFPVGLGCVSQWDWVVFPSETGLCFPVRLGMWAAPCYYSDHSRAVIKSWPSGWSVENGDLDVRWRSRVGLTSVVRCFSKLNGGLVSCFSWCLNAFIERRFGQISQLNKVLYCRGERVLVFGHFGTWLVTKHPALFYLGGEGQMLCEGG